jgi:hypothetical protein
MTEEQVLVPRRDWERIKEDVHTLQRHWLWDAGKLVVAGLVLGLALGVITTLTWQVVVH